MLVLADAGGSNGCRVGLFREKLWELSCQLGMSIRVAHFPSYCSKYNPIDHRLFSHVSRSLKGIIFRSVETVAKAIARTTTSTGLRVKVEVMKWIDERGVKATEGFLMGNFSALRINARLAAVPSVLAKSSPPNRLPCIAACSTIQMWPPYGLERERCKKTPHLW